MLTAAILGCAGYTGQETLDRVLGHPDLEAVALGSDTLAGQPAQALDPRLPGDLPSFTTNAHAARSGALGQPPLDSREPSQALTTR